MTSFSLRKDEYQVGETSVVVRGRLDSAARTRAIVLCHGRSYDADEIELFPDLDMLCSFLAEHGYGVYSINAGGTDTWGNDAAITAVGNAISWLRGANGFANAAEKVLLMGHSMGGLVALNYAHNHPGDVAAIIGGAIATDLDYWHNDPTYGAGVDTAYGGNYAVNSVDHDPVHDYVAGFPIPTRLYGAVDDPLIPNAQLHTFYDQLPAGSKAGMFDLPSGGHTAFWGQIDQFELLSWAHGLAFT